MSHGPCEICDRLAYEALQRVTPYHYVPQGFHGPLPNPEETPVTLDELKQIRDQLRTMAVPKDEHGNYHLHCASKPGAPGDEMIHRNLTLEEYLHGPIPNPEDYPVNQEDYAAPLFPGRRDVRDMVEETLHALLANSDEDGEFDRDFLTDVRDLMRAGVPFLDAVGAFAPTFDVDLSDLFPVSSLYWPN